MDFYWRKVQTSYSVIVSSMKMTSLSFTLCCIRLVVSVLLLFVIVSLTHRWTILPPSVLSPSLSLLASASVLSCEGGGAPAAGNQQQPAPQNLVAWNVKTVLWIYLWGERGGRDAVARLKITVRKIKYNIYSTFCFEHTLFFQDWTLVSKVNTGLVAFRS